MEFKTNPDYETLKLIVLIAGALITFLLAIVGYFMKRQITVQENMIKAVAQLTSSVETMTAVDAERYPTTVKRLDSHRESIQDMETRLTKVETRCVMEHSTHKTH